MFPDRLLVGVTGGREVCLRGPSRAKMGRNIVTFSLVWGGEGVQCPLLGS